MRGEESQIRVLTRPAVAERFADQRIYVAKTPRSSSAICQASDISKGFKAEKTALAHVQPEIFENLLLKAGLTQLFIQYKTDNVSTELTSAKIHSYTSGLQAMTYVRSECSNFKNRTGRLYSIWSKRRSGRRV